MRTAIVGGGAAGFFLAVKLKEQAPRMDVTIFERSHRVLAKVLVSGGGRCNCTNTFRRVTDLAEVYPRGHRLMRRLFHNFDCHDAYTWFERHGVPLVVQDDDCVFPASQDARSIADCLTSEARRLGVRVETGRAVRQLSELADYDFVAVTTGGSPRSEGLQWLADAGHTIEQPVPSLFTFSIDDGALHQLMGTVAPGASVMLAGTRHRASGPLLVTHWGMSGPAILRLSSYAARWLSERQYLASLVVNWTGHHETAVAEQLSALAASHPRRQLVHTSPFDLTQRLWHYLVVRCLGERGATLLWADVGRKDMNRLVGILTSDSYQVSGRAPYRDEFVTCGGISLSSVYPQTLESRSCPHVYFAGEVLDIDGVTGGFNFQAAWTTAYTVARAISSQSK